MISIEMTLEQVEQILSSYELALRDETAIFDKALIMLDDARVYHGDLALEGDDTHPFNKDVWDIIIDNIHKELPSVVREIVARRKFSLEEILDKAKKYPKENLDKYRAVAYELMFEVLAGQSSSAYNCCACFDDFVRGYYTGEKLKAFVLRLQYLANETERIRKNKDRAFAEIDAWYDKEE